jgi:hypothetical protein
VASNFGFVTDTAEGDALEGTVEGSCDGLAEGGFACSWGADEAMVRWVRFSQGGRVEGEENVQ